MDVILEVFIVFAGAKAAGELFVRLRQPALAGELLVGALLGPHVLGWVHLGQAMEVLSQLGIVVLLFTAGLESPISDLLAVGRAAVLASMGGVVLTFGASFAVLAALGIAPELAAPAALALSASSVGIAARAFGDLGALRSRSARVVLGAAVVDDVVVLAALPLALRAGSGGSTGSVVAGIVGAVAFVVALSLIGPRVARRHGGAILEIPRIRRSPFVLALVLCLGLAVLADRVGLAALIGAFLAGMILAETDQRRSLERQMEPLFDLLVPFFFVVSAARVDPGALDDAGVGFLAAVIAVGLLAKPLGVVAGAMGLALRERLATAGGMLPRGEVTLAVAAGGLAAAGKGSPPELYAALVAVVLVSTLLAPILLQVALPPADRGATAPRPEIPPEAFEVEDEDE